LSFAAGARGPAAGAAVDPTGTRQLTRPVGRTMRLARRGILGISPPRSSPRPAARHAAEPPSLNRNDT